MRGPTASHSVTNRSSFSIACAKQALAFELNLASCHIYALNLSDSPACPQERSQPGCACGALHAGSCRHSWKQSRGERTVAQSTPLCPWPAASAPGRRGTFVCRIHVVCYLPDYNLLHFMFDTRAQVLANVGSLQAAYARFPLLCTPSETKVLPPEAG